MAKAFIGGVEHTVRVDRDLGESWAVSVVPAGPARVLSDRPTIVVKLQGDDRASVVKGGLEILVKSGQIERFELETADLPEPEPEKPAAAPAAPAAAPAKPAPAAAPSPAAPAAGGGPAAPQPGAAKPQQS
jgi:2-oxoglutarate dehydrogenase E2 component (dihydrolipoamide succinyltransferase)